MKATTFLIGAFLGMSILSSCSNDDETPVPKDDLPSYWGYFKGTINGKEVSVKNESNGNWAIQSSKHIINYNPPEENEPDATKNQKTAIGLSTGIKYSENEEIGINLFNLYEGMRYITNSTNVDFIYDGIQISRDTNNDNTENRYIHYIPKKENSFKAEITRLTYADNTNTNPIIEANLDGVLYRSDNPKDSIIIKGSYGTR